MLCRNPSYSEKSIIDNPPYPIGQGVVYPLSFLTFIRDTTSLSELKVIAAVWGYDAVIGSDAEALTFTDIQERTALTNKSVSDGIKRAIGAGAIKAKESNGVRYFVPVEKSIPHEHVHVYISDNLNSTGGQDLNHEHAAESKLRQEVYQTLLNEFGMIVSVKVAQNLALTPKYPVSKLQAQIRYTRWEVKHGEDGNAGRPISNPAGRLVYRLKVNKAAPRGFNLETVLLEEEGWTLNRLYRAIFDGEVDMPTIKDGMGYAAWERSGEGRELFYQQEAA